MTDTSVADAIELLDNSVSGRGHTVPITGMPSRKAYCQVEPSAMGYSKVFIHLRDMDGGGAAKIVSGAAAHMTNKEAMALGLALIRCATEVREN